MLELYAMKVARTVLRGCFVVILNGASTDPKIAWGLFNKSEKLQGKLYFLLPVPQSLPFIYQSLPFIIMTMEQWNNGTMVVK